MSSFRRLKISTVFAVVLAFGARGASAQITNFSTDVSTAIDNGLTYLTANGAFNATSSAGDANSFAPASVSGLVFAKSRFQTATSCLTVINRCAIDDPIRPVPHTPTFMFQPPFQRGLLFQCA